MEREEQEGRRKEGKKEEKKRKDERNYMYMDICVSELECVSDMYRTYVRVPTSKLGCSNLLVTVLLRVDVWPGIVQIEVPAPTSSSVDCELEQCLSVCFM